MSIQRATQFPYMGLRLTEVRLENFRSLAAAELKTGGLTVVVGGNSAGKSSLLSSLRLLAQAQQQDEEGLAISLNGREVSLGTFTDLVRRGIAPDVSADVQSSGQPNVGTSMTHDSPSIPRAVKVGLTFAGTIRSGRMSSRRGRPEIAREEREGRKVEINVDMILRESRKLGDGVADVVEFQADLSLDGVHAERMLMRSDVSMNVDSLRRDSVFDLVSGEWSFSLMNGAEEISPLASGTLEVLSTTPNSSPESYSAICERGAGGFPVSIGILKRPVDVVFQWVSEFAAETFYESEEAYEWRRLVERSAKSSRWPGLKSKKGSEQSNPVLPEPRDEDPDTNPIANAAGVLFDAFAEFGPERVGTLQTSGLVRRVASELKFEHLQAAAQLLRDDWEHWAERLRTIDTGWEETLLFPASSDSLLTRGIGAIATILSERVGYLGPLRQGPRALYAYGERGGRDELGQGAEFFAFYLARHKDRKVDLLLPESRNQGVEQVPLQDAAAFWAKRLGILEGLRVVEQSGIGRRVEVLMPGLDEYLSWDRVGVGVSQVLPVIVKVLTATNHSVTLLEQPELHLHPDAQAELAEFLVLAAVKRRQIIVETHSDIFLMRLRRLVLETEVEHPGRLRRDISFVFAQRDPATGISSMRNVSIDRTGSFPEWPAGFADQVSSEAESLLRARSRALKVSSDPR